MRLLQRSSRFLGGRSGRVSVIDTVVLLTMGILLLLVAAPRYMPRREAPPSREAPPKPPEGTPFQGLDVLGPQNLMCTVRAIYARKGEEGQDVRREGGKLVLDQPAAIPAGQDHNVRGVGVFDGIMIKGSFQVVISVDLSRSRFSRRQGAEGSFSHIQACLVSSAPDRPELCIFAAPDRGGGRGGFLWSSISEEHVPFPPNLKVLSFRFKRRGNRLEAWVPGKGGKKLGLAAWENETASAPVRFMDVATLIKRPEGVPLDSVYKSPDEDFYTVTEFAVLCEDPAGCTYRH